MRIRVVLLMGVSGSGKTTVGRLLSNRLGWDFWDADDFHPAENVRKMAAGIPLDDRDRLPWLKRLSRLIERIVQGRQRPAVVACSALKRDYRARLAPSEVRSAVLTVFLRGDKEVIRARLQSRSNHFMPADLLESQFQALEEPEGAIVIDVRLAPEDIAREIEDRLERRQDGAAPR